MPSTVLDCTDNSVSNVLEAILDTAALYPSLFTTPLNLDAVVQPLGTALRSSPPTNVSRVTAAALLHPSANGCLLEGPPLCLLAADRKVAAVLTPSAEEKTLSDLARAPLPVTSTGFAHSSCTRTNSAGMKDR